MQLGFNGKGNKYVLNCGTRQGYIEKNIFFAIVLTYCGKLRKKKRLKQL